MDHLVSFAPAYPPEVPCLVTCCTCFSECWTLSCAWFCLQYLHVHLWYVSICASLLGCSLIQSSFFILSNALISVRSFNTTTHALCASTLLAHASTSLFVIGTLLVLDVKSLIISSNMFFIIHSMDKLFFQLSIHLFVPTFCCCHP